MGSDSRLREVGLDYTTIDAGLLWQVREDVTLGVMSKNLIDVHKSGYIRRTDTRIGKNGFSMPLITTLAVTVEKETWRFACDQELIYGHFGGQEKKKAEFWLMRAGVEKRIFGHLFLRAGVIVPMVARTSSLGDLRDDLPDPKFGLTLGAGISFSHIKADLALTGNPAKSYIEQDLYPQIVASLSLLL